MSISLTNFRSKLNNLLGDTVTGTTTADGADNKKTFIDVMLAKYTDHYFEGHTAYLASEARDIEEFLQPEGIVKVRNAFTDRVLASVPYEIHKNHPDQKKIAINQALLAAYPYFYKRVEDVTLIGKGSSDTEYTVPAGFTDGFPYQLWLKKTDVSDITFEEFFDVGFKEVAGVKKFYADIDTDYTILLIGKTWLTQFTTDASLTELTDEQADIVCLRAAVNMYRMKTAIVDSEDAVRLDTLANQKDLEFEKLIRARRMPALARFNMDWSWLE